MQYTKYPWLMLASIYITQYIGVAFILSAAVAILRQQGVALDKLALLNLALLPLAGKVFYAPVIDKYRLWLQGTYRSWLILSQASMALLLVIAGALDFAHQFTLIIAILAFYVFFMSLQDVSVDGLSCKLFDAESRKLASSIQFSGNLLGNIIGGGLILMFYPWLEWHGSLWLLAGLTSISLIQIVLFTEPEASAYDEQQQKDDKHLLRNIKAFIKQQKHWFIIMALYPIGSTCGFALLNPLLVDNGWHLDDIGFAMKIYGSAIGLFSALLAAPLISKIGRIHALVCVILIQAFALVLMVPLTLGFTDKPMVYAAITVHFISFPALLVVSATIIMDKAALTRHKATFFSLQFSFASLLGFIYSAASMAIAKHVGYSPVVTTGAALTFGIALLVWIVLGRNKTNHHINTLCNAKT
ncbi:MFS transporter [Marinomonas transparens]|uniref:MFS transporter n=1 Tax=Marinomonas transparens TaxID=2795388 RepID=A0A934JL09_9GAMM|nr:MFS transporter [Marinomonas transparens]MBJ7538095.1 MFS transporter [Marinomonas transparens]